MKKSLILGALLAGFALPAVAQVGVVPGTGVIAAYRVGPTYSASSIGLVPAASATDIFCIAGSASKNIAINRIEISGVAGTLTSVPVVVAKRAAVNTAGTAATGVALPAAAAHDTNNPTATATLIAYTANPTITDSAPVYTRARYLTTPTVAAGTNSPAVIWDFGNVANALNQPIILRGAAQQVCLNLQAASISSGVLDINIEWTEN